MKRILFLSLIILTLVVVSCQEDMSDEQIPTIMAVAVIKPIAEATEVMVEDSAAVPPATIDAIATPLAPPSEESIATLQLKFETDGAMAVRSFDITEYEFVDGSLDDWISEVPDARQPWVALGRVLTAPYYVSQPVEFEPVWLVLKPADMPDSALLWEESVEGKLLEELSIFETVTLNDPTNFEALLQARNGYYLPEADGILWIERLLIKTSETTGELYNFVPEAYRRFAANLPYTFVCDDVTARCVWTHRFKSGSESYREFQVLYDEELFPDSFPRTTYWTTDNRALVCYTEEGVCFDSPHIVQCDSEDSICTYQHRYESRNSQVFTLVSSMKDWDFNAQFFATEQNAQRYIYCELEKQECNFTDVEFSCEYDLYEQPAICTVLDRNVPNDQTTFTMVTARQAKWQKEEPVMSYNEMSNNYICNEIRQECFFGTQHFSDASSIGYSFECDETREICTFISVYDEPIVQFSLLADETGLVDDTSKQLYEAKDGQHVYLCDELTKSCWVHMVEEHHLLECVVGNGESVSCRFEKTATHEQKVVPLVFAEPVGFVASEYFSKEGGASWSCDWELGVCYDPAPYEGVCSILTGQCKVSHLYLSDSFFTFNYVDVPDELEEALHLGNNLVCDFVRGLCSYPLGGGGGAWESRRCNLLKCPDGYFCSAERYRQYSCVLYKTPHPQR